MAFLKHKFGARSCIDDGIKFPSLKERKRYRTLKLLQEQGEVITFLRQTPFYLPGGVKYICDFQVFWKDGSVTFEDVKGFKTPIYKNKKAMVEEIYNPIKITEI